MERLGVLLTTKTSSKLPPVPPPPPASSSSSSSPSSSSSYSFRSASLDQTDVINEVTIMTLWGRKVMWRRMISVVIALIGIERGGEKGKRMEMITGTETMVTVIVIVIVIVIVTLEPIAMVMAIAPAAIKCTERGRILVAMT